MNLYNILVSLSEIRDKKYWPFSWYSIFLRCTWMWSWRARGLLAYLREYRVWPEWEKPIHLLSLLISLRLKTTGSHCWVVVWLSLDEWQVQTCYTCLRWKNIFSNNFSTFHCGLKPFSNVCIFMAPTCCCCCRINSPLHNNCVLGPWKCKPLKMGLNVSENNTVVSV